MNAANNRAPGAGVRRTLAQRLQEWTANAVMKAAASDIAVAERLLRIGNLVEPPGRLRDPTLMSRILLANLRLPRPA